MKLYGMSALSAAVLAAILASTPVVAGAKNTKAPKTAKACAKFAKKGWKWESGKCVKGDAPAKAAAEAKKAKPAAAPVVTEPMDEMPAEDEGAFEE